MSGALLTGAWVCLAVVGLARLRPRPSARWPLPSAHSVRPAAAVAPSSGPGRRGHRRARVAVDAGIPDLIDLFSVAVGAGLNVSLAVGAVSRRAPPGPLALALQGVVDEVTAGGRLAEALETVPQQLGSEAIRPLVNALVEAQRYGAALGPSLDRLADEARRSRQRRAEEAARRVPVKLLFPLVACVLPAFGLLTVAPLIAGGLRALRL